MQTPVSVGGDERRRRLWTPKLRMLQSALAPDMENWHVLLDVRLLRAGRAVDAVILAPHCIVACTLRAGRRHTAWDAAEDAALDLHDFHAGSRVHPVVPLLVTAQAPHAMSTRPLMFPGVTACLQANAESFGPLLRELAGLAPSGPALDVESWAASPYRPMPGLIEAACALYARHGVADIAAAGADGDSLRATHSVIADAIAGAAAGQRPIIVFVTGIPGAGKTLCGLNVALASDMHGRATFLTGNPALVHVLREALARDAAPTRAALRAARQRMESVIQALPAFRDSYAPAGVPPERVIVIDEAQRCWTAPHAIAKTAGRRVPLTQSEPAHLLDIMARRGDGPVIVCLVGSGQEIHDGEGGLAAWGVALQDRPDWQVHAPADAYAAPIARQRLSAPVTVAADALHLTSSVRSLRCRDAPAWVDAVLAGNDARARELAGHHPAPFTVVRDLATLRACLRRTCRGFRRAGLLASSGARRLRAEGLGSVLPHDDPAAVARWFLDRFPDVRASDALETAATEFFCQGLELRYYVARATTTALHPGTAPHTSKAGRTAMQNIKTSLRRSAFVIGAVMALAFLLLSCNFAIAHTAAVGLKAKFDPVLEARIRGVLIGCRTKNVNPMMLQDDLEQLGNVRDASDRLNLSFWGKSDMPDPFCPQEISVVRVAECFGRYRTSGLICQKSCCRSATVPNRKQDIFADFVVRLNGFQNVESISEINRSVDGSVGLTPSLLKGEYEENRSKGRNYQGSPADPIQAALSFDVPLPIRLLCGAMLSFCGMFLAYQRQSLALAGWVLMVLGGLLWIPGLPNF